MTNSLSKPKKKSTLAVRVEPVKPVKVKVQAVKPEKVKQKQAKPAQAPAYRNEDFEFATTADATGVHIYIIYLTRPIQKFDLYVIDYQLWERFQSPQQKYDYIRGRVNPRAFWRDAQLIHEVIQTICNILDTLFAEAHKTQRRI